MVPVGGNKVKRGEAATGVRSGDPGCVPAGAVFLAEGLTIRLIFWTPNRIIDVSANIGGMKGNLYG